MLLGHSVTVVETLAAVHHALRHSDPDFVIVDSETFPEPANDYRKIIQTCMRRFLLYYDTQLTGKENSQIKHAASLTKEQAACLSDITDTFTDIHMYKMLTSSLISQNTAERQLFLKQHHLRLPHAQLLGRMLHGMNADIPAAALIQLLWSDDSSSHRQTLYAYINQIRDLLEKRNIPLIIERRTKGTYRISIKKSRPNDEAASSYQGRKAAGC